MTIKWKDGETTWIVLPREVHLLISFLRSKGFDPKPDPFDERVTHVNKELFHDMFTDDWHKFTGYDKILAKLLSGQKNCWTSC